MSACVVDANAGGTKSAARPTSMAPMRVLRSTTLDYGSGEPGRGGQSDREAFVKHPLATLAVLLAVSGPIPAPVTPAGSSGPHSGSRPNPAPTPAPPPAEPPSPPPPR